MRRFVPLIIVIAILCPTLAHSAGSAAMIPAFERTWSHDDATVADGEEQRSWTWGPDVLRSASEPYIQSPGGQRQVWYLDKARMEITHPDADPDNDWYVTSGLLVRELISGKMQIGDTDYETWQPSAVPIAGDLDAAPGTTITYGDMRPLATVNSEWRAPKAASGAPVIDVVAPGGAVTQNVHYAVFGAKLGGYDDVVGHNIAAFFLDALPTDTLLYVAGRPLTEPYWAQVPVAHQQRDVLVQAFERRVLTYTPTNPDGWKVEWGNVGRQYAQWRYGRLDAGDAFAPNATVDASAAVHDLREVAPAAADIAASRQGLVGAAVYDTDSGAFYSFQGRKSFTMYSIAKVPIMLAILDRAVREQRRVTTSEQNLIESMIHVSDNDAASALYSDIGGAAGVGRYLRRIGIMNTQMSDYGWGASTTTAQDMTRLMAKLGSCTILVPRLCRYALDTMRSVVDSQRWGVSAGVPGDGSVALKNGWYPDDSGWGINSIGLISSEGKHYAIAILTYPNPSMGYGIDTIQKISAAIYPTLH